MSTAEFTGTWSYSTLPGNVHLGHDCHIERRRSFERFRSLQEPGLILGDRVKAYTWTEFNVEPDGVIEIGHDSVLVGALFMCQQRITLGQRILVSYNVTIADSDFHPHPELRKLDTTALARRGRDATTAVRSPTDRH